MSRLRAGRDEEDSPESIFSEISSGSQREVVPSIEQVEEEARSLVFAGLADDGIERARALSGLDPVELAKYTVPLLLEERRSHQQIAEIARNALLLPSRQQHSRFDRFIWPRWVALRSALALIALGGAGGVLVGLFIGPSVLAVAAIGAGAGAGAALAVATQVPALWRLRVRSLGEWEAKRQRLADHRQDLIETVVLPELRERINQVSEPGFSAELTPADPGGLRALFDPAYEVSVDATSELIETLAGLKAGSVGVAGPRGVGKTTLIKAACEDRLRGPNAEEIESPTGIMVSAPVRYGGEDFVRFLFGQLCLSELGSSLNHENRERIQARVRRSRLVSIGLLVSAAVCVGAIIVGFTGVQIDPRVWLAGLGYLGLLMLGTVFLPQLRQTLQPRARLEDPVKLEARGNLEQLRFLETLSEEQSGELSSTLAKVGVKRGVSRAAQPWTFPEVVENYRRFLGALANRRPVVIGIDELDKMASAEEARSFLNEMKSLFDQTNVYYLVSISEEALSDFERRGQPLRDVFDSVFSEVLHVDYLNRAESDVLLRRRAVGVPPPWPALFHCMAGGLPREAIRVARRAVQIAERDGANLNIVTPALVAERASAHEHAAEIVAQGDVGADGTQPVLTWLSDLTAFSTHGLPGPSSLDQARAGLSRRLEVGAVMAEVRKGIDAPGGAERVARMQRLVMELVAGWHHSLSCLEFFGQLDERRFGDACQPAADGLTAIDLLAKGHQDLSKAPSLSWQTVSEFRERMDLPRLSYPQ